MATKAKNQKPKRVKTKKAYLTKRVVVRAAGSAMRKASAKALEAAGYTVVVKDGWVVKKDADGKITRIKKVETTKRPAKIVLD